MTVNSYQINDSLQIIPISADQTLDLIEKNKERVWVNMKDFERDELNHWFDIFKLKGLTKELLEEGRNRMGFYPFNSELLMIIPVIADAGAEGYLAILCRKNQLLTIHKDNISCLDPSDLSQIESETWLYAASTAALLSAILMDLSLDLAKRVNELKLEVDEMESRFANDTNSLDFKDITAIRTKQLLFESIMFGQSPCINGLKAIEKSFFNSKDAKDYLNCSEVNLLAVKNLLDRLENRILDLRSQIEMKSQENGNRKLNMLSIVSAVFLPATFLAGFWGMNFKYMPLLETTTGFIIAIIIMLVIPIWMMVYFYIKGWFKK